MRDMREICLCSWALAAGIMYSITCIHLHAIFNLNIVVITLCWHDCALLCLQSSSWCLSHRQGAASIIRVVVRIIQPWWLDICYTPQAHMNKTELTLRLK